jgi:6-phosphogluconolactonase
MPVSLRLEVVDDPARAASAMLLSAMLGGGDVVLTGGTTPRPAYEELARAVRTVGHDLRDTTVWFSDERCVPPDDELSNYRLVKQSLLDPLADMPRPAVRRMRGELGPEEAAEAYERELDEAGEPEFSMVLLGLGSDAHMASMFPDQASLSERARLVVGVEEAGLEPFVPRVTLTLPALANAEQVVFLVTGAGKADAVAAAFGPGAEPDPHVPSSMLVPLAKELTVLLDAAAAGRL